MRYELDHIGIAVRSLSESLSFYRDFLGFEVEGEEVVETENVRIAKLKCGNVVLELLEGEGDASVIKKYIEKKGEGFHHLCLGVEGLETVVREMKRKGIRFAGEAPRKGAGGSWIAFLHPSQTSGILIELREKSPDGRKGSPA